MHEILNLFQDLLYNTTTSSGWVYTKVRNKRQVKRKQNAAADIGHLVEANEYLTEDEKKKHILFFRTCVMPRDKEKLKVLMKATVPFRKELLKDCDFSDIFKFYFSSPDLVIR